MENQNNPTPQEKYASQSDSEALLETKTYNQTFTLSRYALIGLVVMILIVSSILGGIFGFMAGGASNNLFANILKKAKISQPQQSTPADVEKITNEDAVIIGIADKTSPAVVSIVISKNIPIMRNNGFPFGFGFPLDPFGDEFGSGSDGNQIQGDTQKQQIGGGTGYIVSVDGMIVTNKHVVSDQGAEYTVIMTDGKEYPAKVLARDPSQDIAVIKIEAANLPVLEFGDSSSLKIGQTVIAIGNSLGEFSNTVSKGIISGLKRNVDAGSGMFSQSEHLTNIIQTDAAINPGNSGGPLIDINGKVIGMNVAMAQGAQNIGFALPANQIQKVISQVKQTGKITIPFLGVRYIPVNTALQKENNLPFSYGVLIQRGGKITDLAVIPGSPADKAGIMENDIILEINEEKINENNQLSDLVSKYNVGDKITLKVWHKGDIKDVQVVLQERKQ